MRTAWDDFERSFGAVGDLRSLMSQWVGGFDGVRARGGECLWPRLDVRDEGATVVVTAEVPGLGEGDVKLTATADTLTLEGERRAEAPAGHTTHRHERPAVKFSRTVSLACRVDTAGVTAAMRHGVLTVTLPKAREAQPRQIPVTAQ